MTAVGLPRYAFRLLMSWLACVLWMGAAQAADAFLPPEQAFPLNVRALDAQRIELQFGIARGYYLYNERFNAQAEGAGVAVGELQVPPGTVKYDETFEKDMEVLRESATLVLVLQGEVRETFKLSVGNQGCADKGLCYVPQTRSFQVEPGQGPGGGLRLTALSDTLPGWPSSSAPAPGSVAAAASAEAPGAVSSALRSGNLAMVAGLFLLLGLGLSFTPCVLPMLPILSSIILGQGGPISKARGFSLAVAYSLGMALVYTVFGVVSALVGEGLGAALQNAWVLGAFALVLVAFSLSMFGLYELQVPVAWQTRLNEASQRVKGGRHASVFLMGGISSLIVGPCVAAPLAGALVYISQTRDVVLGGFALFSMAVGMSVPLLLLGLSAGALLPRAGAWMTHVKHVFGVMLLGVALWMVSPVLPAQVLLLLCAVLLVVAAAYLGAFARLPQPASAARQVAKGVGLLLCVWAAAQVIGAAAGARDWTRPLAQLRAAPASLEAEAPQFQAISSLSDLDAAVRASSRPVMLDFYADWCVACKEFEHFTFTDPGVAQQMAGLTLLRADVTANNDDHKALMRRFTLFGPPAMLFFAPGGNELPNSRVIGFQNAETFGRHLDRIDSTVRVSRN